MIMITKIEHKRCEEVQTNKQKINLSKDTLKALKIFIDEREDIDDKKKTSLFSGQICIAIEKTLCSI